MFPDMEKTGPETVVEARQFLGHLGVPWGGEARRPPPQGVLGQEAPLRRQSRHVRLARGRLHTDSYCHTRV
jgi:hypothetical protein